MKIDGRVVEGRNVRSVEIRRPEGALHLTVQALTLGFESLLASRGVRRPVVPRRVARDSRGLVVRDESGQAVLIPDDRDENYQHQLEEFARRTVCLEVIEGLAADPSVQFEAGPPAEDGDWAGYADAVYQELADAGFSDGDLLALVRGIHAASNLISDQIADEQNRFFPDRPAETS